jgi:hypothetical protein
MIEFKKFCPETKPELPVVVGDVKSSIAFRREGTDMTQPAGPETIFPYTNKGDPTSQ